MNSDNWIDLIAILNYQHFFTEFKGDNLLGQAVSFFVAGMEATSTAIAFCLYELSLHPEIEERLYEEIKKSSTSTFEEINSLEYLDQVVNESLRLYPPLPEIDRIALKDYKVQGMICLRIPVKKKATI